MSNYIRMFAVLYCCFFAAFALFNLTCRERRRYPLVDWFNIIVQPTGATYFFWAVITDQP